ncbi:MAG TPA: hypothetical protein VFH56_02315 [Acidimicrobiales bacterium]|nr:hypothetical protein [Acidimicrobiales bacterium]
MASGKKQWSAAKKSRMDENWAKARKREEARIKAHPKGQNVSLKAHNGKSVDGYSVKPELVEARARRKAERAAKHAQRKEVAA